MCEILAFGKVRLFYKLKFNDNFLFLGQLLQPEKEAWMNSLGYSRYALSSLVNRGLHNIQVWERERRDGWGLFPRAGYTEQSLKSVSTSRHVTSTRVLMFLITVIWSHQLSSYSSIQKIKNIVYNKQPDLLTHRCTCRVLLHVSSICTCAFAGAQLAFAKCSAWRFAVEQTRVGGV